MDFDELLLELGLPNVLDFRTNVKMNALSLQHPPTRKKKTKS